MRTKQAYLASWQLLAAMDVFYTTSYFTLCYHLHCKLFSCTLDKFSFSSLFHFAFALYHKPVVEWGVHGSGLNLQQ
jgi:hypothetical protein